MAGESTTSARETAPATGDAPVLEVRSLQKRFGATLALDGVSLELGQGEVLALLGDNGAGKSTLIKILSGVVHPDQGEILIEGRPQEIDSPVKARRLGIETVYQDLALFDNMDATSNFYAGREPSRPKWLRSLGWVNDRAMSRETDELLERLQVNVAKDMEIGLMSGGQRQAVACARAIAFGKRIVILDEPTSALGARESGNVLRLIKDAPQHGVSVIVISHNLEHVMRVADRAVVLRQGKYVGEAVPDEEHHEELVSMIVGGGGGEDPDRSAGTGRHADAPPADAEQQASARG
jgi:D-xylose transport system ATP-binding protein